jgi:hypothetical protein
MEGGRNLLEEAVERIAQDPSSPAPFPNERDLSRLSNAELEQLYAEGNGARVPDVELPRALARMRGVVSQMKNDGGPAAKLERHVNAIRARMLLERRLEEHAAAPDAHAGAAHAGAAHAGEAHAAAVPGRLAEAPPLQPAKRLTGAGGPLTAHAALAANSQSSLRGKREPRLCFLGGGVGRAVSHSLLAV